YKGTAAGYVHDESRDITDATLVKAIESRNNIIIDSTLRNPEKSKILFDEARKKGYKVVLLSNIVPLEISLNRAVNRFLNPGEEGRYVPIERIIREHDKTNRSQFELIKYADKGKIFDSNVEKTEPLKMIISKG
ncbi:MAG: zeta toxin family protein, partial [Ignavibacteria bacterium]|nr:zeta toxin family protein [Ignavibacteria bacterium]